MYKTTSGERAFVDAFKDVKAKKKRCQGEVILGVGGPQSNWQVPCKRQKKGVTGTEDKLHEDRGRDGREQATSPGTPEAPKLEKAERTLSWRFWRDLSPAPP